MTTFTTSREIPASAEQVFAAISTPERLARRRGPAGFTNTFEVCEFTPGGRRVYTMHWPNGWNHPNESVFSVIEAPYKVVIQHVCEPRYELTIELEQIQTWAQIWTVVFWEQVFENEKIGKGLEHIVVPANEQNLDRLTDEVLNNIF